VTLEVASIRDVPLYDGDLEAEAGVPAPVREFKDRIASADGLLLVTSAPRSRSRSEEAAEWIRFRLPKAHQDEADQIRPPSSRGPF
jgi:NAD(P)H-dependent FMN reductase